MTEKAFLSLDISKIPLVGQPFYNDFLKILNRTTESLPQYGMNVNQQEEYLQRIHNLDAAVKKHLVIEGIGSTMNIEIISAPISEGESVPPGLGLFRSDPLLMELIIAECPQSDEWQNFSTKFSGFFVRAKVDNQIQRYFLYGKKSWSR